MQKRAKKTGENAPEATKTTQSRCGFRMNEAKTKGQETEFRSQKAEDEAVAKQRANTPTERSENDSEQAVATRQSGRISPRGATRPTTAGIDPYSRL